MEYIMSLRSYNGMRSKLNSVIWRTKASSLSEAKNYFVRLKNLPEEEFNKMFIVTEVKKDGNEK